MDTEQVLQPEDAQGDVDPALGDDQSSLTQSLRSSLLESVKENGRGYHRYKSTAGNYYVFPEDELEQERLDLQHEMFLFTFGRNLYNAPLDKGQLKEVLDLGTGTGIWAVDFADEYPNVQVTGTDLSPIQPQYIPSNCKFEVDDFNSEWTFSQKFDFIHVRGLCGSSKPFEIQGVIRQAYEALAPGGWLEMPDVCMPFGDVDGTMKGTKIEEWVERQYDACSRIGIDVSAAASYKQWMMEAGFENVTELKYKWPIGTWPKDLKQKQLGFTLRLWSGVLGMEYEQIMADLVDVRKDIANPKIHAYWPMYSAFGQKKA